MPTMAAALSFVALFAVRALSAPVCDDNIVLTITASALGLVIPPIDNSSLVTANYSSYLTSLATNLSTTLPTSLLDGTYTISGRYCKPEVYNASRADTLQFLVHGAGYTRDYWSGLGFPGTSDQVNGTTYSWVDYASQQGYPTFSFDRICNGRSQKLLSPLCQLPLNAEIMHGMIQNFRNGTAIPGKNFERVVFVGHSVGSIAGNVHAQVYPDDVEAYVLTGFTAYILQDFGSVVVVYQPIPAPLVDSGKWGSLDPLYFVSTSRSGFETVFYYGDYEENVVNTDYANRGPFATGEVATLPLGALPAPGFKGSLFVLNGLEDRVLCGQGELGALLDAPGNCGTDENGYTGQVRNLYPSARDFGWYNQPQTSHDVNLHCTAQDSFARAHEYLAGQGF